MYQMKDAFEELGVNCSVLGDGEFGEVNEKGNLSVRKMCVGMVQTLAQRLEETTVENEFQLLYNALTRKQEKEITALKKQLLDAGISGPEIKTRLSRMIDAQQKELEDKAPSMMQKAERKFKEKSLQRAQTIAVLERFEFVILEEAHEASGNSYYEIMRHCKNAHYRLALTGTPFMRESQESNMRLMACSGPIAIKISEEMLIERGILAKPYFKTVELSKNPPKLHIATAWQAAYRLGIVENEERNVKIVNEVLMAMRYGLSTMVLVQHTSHGEKLMKILEMAGVRALYIQGENDQVERKAALKALANGEIDVLIGTTILDVGVDVPAVGLIILAGGGKAEVALRQRIGRGLRAKKLGPNVAFVVDFNDPFNRILREHAAQRLEIIKQTKGFNEGITPEFEYEKLGFKKVA
jgi:superfamily II DNA or RNA helicase